MQTHVLLEQVSNCLNRNVRLLLQQKYGKMFYPYLMLNAATDLKGLYVDSFRTYFRDYSGRLAEKIAFAALNLTYALKVHLDMNPQVKLDDLLAYAKRFIEAQLEDYYDWSADLSAH